MVKLYYKAFYSIRINISLDAIPGPDGEDNTRSQSFVCADREL